MRAVGSDPDVPVSELLFELPIQEMLYELLAQSQPDPSHPARERARNVEQRTQAGKLLLARSRS